MPRRKKPSDRALTVLILVLVVLLITATALLVFVKAQDRRGEQPVAAQLVPIVPEAAGAGVEQYQSEEPKTGEPHTHEYLPPAQPVETLRPHSGEQKPPGRAVSGRIVLILDDAGESTPHQWAFIKLPARLTFAVLPDCEHTAAFTQRARDAGHRLIVHVPMLPMDYRSAALPARFLQPGMSALDMRIMLDDFFSQVPGAVGMNNHMGSAATSDPVLMQELMDYLSVRGRFFIDSVTHAASVGYSSARKAGLPALKRDVFLDHDNEYHSIRERLLHLADLAAQRGFAVGIGHVTSANTLAVLQKMIPELQQRGFQFVDVMEVMR
jgi:uncharacterized protein